MKNTFTYYAALLSFILLGSCTNIDDLTQSSVYNQLNIKASMFEDEGLIVDAGLFFVKQGDNLNTSCSLMNMHYQVDEWGTLCPTDNLQGDYLNDDTFQLISYSPYNPLCSRYYDIDLKSSQDIQEGFYYAKSGWVNKDYTESCELVYCNQLSKLNIDLRDSIGNCINGANVLICRPAKARFDLINGQMSIDFSCNDTIAFHIGNSLVNYYILPGSYGSMLVEYNGSVYEWDMSDTNFKIGEITTRTLVLNSDILKKADATVDDWINVDGGTIVVR